jgi:dCTP diphosphatase
MWVSPGTVAPVRDDGLEDVLQRLRRFTGERHWSRFHDPKNLAMLVASEAGELVHLFRWVRNDEADAFATRPENRPPIEEEIADVAIGVLLLADRLGVDLLELVRAKIARNAQKYPVAHDGGVPPSSGAELRLVPGRRD